MSFDVTHCGKILLASLMLLRLVVGGVVGGARVGMFEVGRVWMKPGWIYLQWAGHVSSSDVNCVLFVSQDVVAWADSTESTLYVSLTVIVTCD